jgi:hypothetical protein
MKKGVKPMLNIIINKIVSHRENRQIRQTQEDVEAYLKGEEISLAKFNLQILPLVTLNRLAKAAEQREDTQTKDLVTKIYGQIKQKEDNNRLFKYLNGTDGISLKGLEVRDRDISFVYRIASEASRRRDLEGIKVAKEASVKLGHPHAMDYVNGTLDDILLKEAGASEEEIFTVQKNRIYMQFPDLAIPTDNIPAIEDPLTKAAAANKVMYENILSEIQFVIGQLKSQEQSGTRLNLSSMGLVLDGVSTPEDLQDLNEELRFVADSYRPLLRQVAIRALEENREIYGKYGVASFDHTDEEKKIAIAGAIKAGRGSDFTDYSTAAGRFFLELYGN